MHLYTISANNFVILVLYIDDNLLASNNVNLLIETKQMLSKHFEIKDLGDIFIVLSMQIHHDRSLGMLGLSQRLYIEEVLKMFNMSMCSHTYTPTQKVRYFQKFSVFKMMMKEQR